MRCFALCLAFFTLWATAPTYSMTLDRDIFRPGTGYKVKRIKPPKPSECAKLCTEDPKCVSFNYIRPQKSGRAGQCMLSDEVHGAWRSNCCVSGIKAVESEQPVATFADITLEEDGESAAPAPGTVTAEEGGITPASFAMDLCLRQGEDCGWPAATAYCKAQGFARAVDFLIKRGAPPTMTWGDRAICKGQFCHRIERINCADKIED